MSSTPSRSSSPAPSVASTSTTMTAGTMTPTTKMPTTPSPVAGLTSAQAHLPVRIKRQPNAPVSGNSSLQITDIYGFGTPAPDYLLTEEFSPAVTPSSSGRRGRFTRPVTNRRGRSPNPLVWDNSSETRDEVLKELSAMSLGGRRRARSVPPPAATPALEMGAAPLPKDVTQGSGAQSVSGSRKRGTFDKVPGGEPYSFKADPNAQDPLTMHPKSKAGGEVKYLSSKRLRRPGSPSKVKAAAAADGSGAASSLSWKEE
ncbi:hypothetical protein BCR44DRAFT_68051 [Catenaria anguillulae PL171]|uniref:Uncharacterized protein n=1 Tax=Catenaria anguillulae PL171 TaxID=765915 RepID=A0A1Y2HW50_9FUNG|nr:hypothetical protein BCR44DRAFT_68051 [Catenaria anguillulae PL171]